MSVNIDSINNVITGYDNSSRNAYNLFSFVDDSQNEYNTAAVFEQDLSNMFTNFRPYVLSEDSNSCLITNIERLNYDTKLNKLITILNNCKDPNVVNKDECMYNEFIKPETIQTIKDLTAIVSKINSECIFKNVVLEEQTNICNANRSEMFNNYSNVKIDKNYDFINKYSTIITELKTIADNNLKDYLVKCNQDPDRVVTYNNVQNTLARALFETEICPQPITCPPERECPDCPENTCPEITKDTCMANPDIISDINKLKLDKESIQTQYNILSKNKTLIEQEYQTFKNDADSFIWDSTFSVRNGWIFFGIIFLLLIIIFILGYFSFGKVSKDRLENDPYRPF